MVLTDDNFATIEAAVEQGRGSSTTCRSSSRGRCLPISARALVILVAVLAGLTLPITPLQILWINMTTAVLLGLTLAFEPVEPDVMSRAPRPPGAPILDSVLTLRIVLVGILLLGGALACSCAGRAWGEPGGIAHHRRQRVRGRRDLLSIQLPLAGCAILAPRHVLEPLALGRGAADGDAAACLYLFADDESALFPRHRWVLVNGSRSSPPARW